ARKAPQVRAGPWIGNQGRKEHRRGAVSGRLPTTARVEGRWDAGGVPDEPSPVPSRICSGKGAARGPTILRSVRDHGGRLDQQGRPVRRRTVPWRARRTHGVVLSRGGECLRRFSRAERTTFPRSSSVATSP